MQQARKLDKRIIPRRTLVWLTKLGDGYIVFHIDEARRRFIACNVMHDREGDVLDQWFTSEDILFYTNKIKPKHAELLLANKGL